jgi:hypothetical protein
MPKHAADLSATTGNMTDICDILALPAHRRCRRLHHRAVMPVSHTADGAVMAAQTWDLNPTDLDSRGGRTPSTNRWQVTTLSPETLSVTRAGCPSLDRHERARRRGLAPTNIKTRRITRGHFQNSSLLPVIAAGACCFL